MSFLATELLLGEVTSLCAPGLSLTSFILGSFDLCFQAPCTQALLSCGTTFVRVTLQQRLRSGPPLHPALQPLFRSPKRVGVGKVSTQTQLLSLFQFPMLYIQTTCSSCFLTDLLSGKAEWWKMRGHGE